MTMVAESGYTTNGKAEKRRGQRSTRVRQIRFEKNWTKVATANALCLAADRHADIDKLHLRMGKGGRPKRYQ